jgi:hypothetical protein
LVRNVSKNPRHNIAESHSQSQLILTRHKFEGFLLNVTRLSVCLGSSQHGIVNVSDVGGSSTLNILRPIVNIIADYFPVTPNLIIFLIAVMRDHRK